MAVRLTLLYDVLSVLAGGHVLGWWYVHMVDVDPGLAHAQNKICLSRGNTQVQAD